MAAHSLSVSYVEQDLYIQYQYHFEKMHVARY